MEDIGFLILWGGGDYNQGHIQKILEKEMSSYQILFFLPKFYRLYRQPRTIFKMLDTLHPGTIFKMLNTRQPGKIQKMLDTGWLGMNFCCACKTQTTKNCMRLEHNQGGKVERGHVIIRLIYKEDLC